MSRLKQEIQSISVFFVTVTLNCAQVKQSLPLAKNGSLRIERTNNRSHNFFQQFSFTNFKQRPLKPQKHTYTKSHTYTQTRKHTPQQTLGNKRTATSSPIIMIHRAGVLLVVALVTTANASFFGLSEQAEEDMYNDDSIDIESSRNKRRLVLKSEKASKSESTTSFSTEFDPTDNPRDSSSEFDTSTFLRKKTPNRERQRNNRNYPSNSETKYKKDKATVSPSLGPMSSTDKTSTVTASSTNAVAPVTKDLLETQFPSLSQSAEGDTRSPVYPTLQPSKGLHTPSPTGYPTPPKTYKSTKTGKPTLQPSQGSNTLPPTGYPTPPKTSKPTKTKKPTLQPSQGSNTLPPTSFPTPPKTSKPTKTNKPTRQPTPQLIIRQTFGPTTERKNSIAAPTGTPTIVTNAPTSPFPTEFPTSFPNEFESTEETDRPTLQQQDTVEPTYAPTSAPTGTPTIVTSDPTSPFPTEFPTDFPTEFKPTNPPRVTDRPTLQQQYQDTDEPTYFTSAPTSEFPTSGPTDFPTDFKPTNPPRVTDRPVLLPEDTDEPTYFTSAPTSEFPTSGPTGFPTQPPRAFVNDESTKKDSPKDIFNLF